MLNKLVRLFFAALICISVNSKAETVMIPSEDFEGGVLEPFISLQSELISDFDDGTLQGWSEGDPFNNGFFGGTLSVINSGGNPGGYIRATDSVTGGGSLAVLAPTLLSGDLTLLGGLSWDALLPSQAIFSTNVLLEGTDGTFYRSEYAVLGTHPRNSWFAKSVDFGSDIGWQLLSGTASFSSVVSNTNALYIELDAVLGLGIEASIDNIKLTRVDTDNDGIFDDEDTDDDGDGLPDIYEISNDLDPLNALDAALDNDDDGLTNLAEFLYGTDINNADTDGDGLADNIDNYPLVFDEVKSSLYTGQLTILPDITGDEVSEIGVLVLDESVSKIRFKILNGRDMNVVDEIIWNDNFVDSTIAVHVMPDMDDNGYSDLGVFGIQDLQNKEGKPQLFVKDLETGSHTIVYNWPANWKEVSPIVLEDMTGDGLSEIAIQGRFKDGNRPQLVVKVGGTGTILDTYSYPDLFVSPKYYQHSDINGDGINEIATFGRLISNNKIQTKLADGMDAGTNMPAYNFPDKWDNVSWHRLGDSNGDGQDDWGMFGTLREDGRPQLVNKDGVSPAGALRIFAWTFEMQNAQFFRIPDMNNDGVDDVAAAGRRSNNNRYQFQVKDGTDRNVILANHNLNLNLESVTYHVLPDLNGDEQVEIGFLGINPLGEYELVIQHGDTVNGEYAMHNLGSDWENAPAITSLGDTDDDGLSDLLVYGQNASGEQLVMTSL